MITVYEGPNFSEFKEASSAGNIGSWDHAILGKPELRSKFFGLLTFQWESNFAAKNWVMKMELMPESKLLKFHVLKTNGLQQIYMPINNMIPITKYDYWCASWLCFLKQSTHLDLDMIYANHVSKEMYCFDKMGTWEDAGVYHELLNMDNTFSETNWYDEFNV